MGILEQSIQALKVLTPALGMIPAVGDNLKGAAELASEICELVKTIRENRDRYEALGHNVVRLLDAITRELDQSALKRAEEIKPKVKDLIRLLEEIRAAVRKRTPEFEAVPHPDSPPPTGTCDRISNWLCNTTIDVRRLAADGTDLDDMEAKLQAVIQEFHLTTVIRSEIKLDGLNDLAGRIFEHTSALKAEMVQMNERGKRIDRDADIQLINSLEPVVSAAWDMGEAITCAPSTRVLILSEALAWAETSGGSCVFWMNGLAGTGKSTIARTFCQHLEAQKQLAANFFVNRQDQARRDEVNIVQTISHQLAIFDQSFGDALCTQLRNHPMSAPRSLSKRIVDFIIGPADALSMSDRAPLVIVIDALDECTLDTHERPAGDLILLLVRGLLTLSGRLKLFITSRAEPVIKQMFDQLSTSEAHTVVKLHELEKSLVQADIETYLRYSFEQMKAYMPYRLDLSHWPSARDLEQLVQHSGVLFVYASTVVRYVGSRRDSPRDRLAQVLDHRGVAPLTAPYKALDTLYMQVLEEAVGMRTRQSMEPQYEPEEVDSLCQRVRATIAVIVLAQVPIRADTVATLTGESHDGVLIALDRLSALLLLEDAEPVRVFHPSFPDFVLDSKRCPNPRLHLNPAVDHSSLAFQCLRVMNMSLRYNICELSSPDVSNTDVVDLETRLREYVSDALRYACCFWMIHIEKSGPPESQLREELATFCRKHALHWLEVLSLLQFWSSTDSNFLKAIEWCQRQNVDAHGTCVTRLLQDTLQILQIYGIPIRSHALHLYHSAFVTMPRCPLLETLAQEHVPESLPILLSPRVPRLDRAARVIEGHRGKVRCVAYSPDGTRIVSGSQDFTIRVWSAVTFEELGRVEGHNLPVTSVIFSPDGGRIVSASEDRTLRIWSIIDLENIATIKGHQALVSSVAVSPDGSRLISGSHDGTLRVWCASSFVELGRLEGYGSKVLSVAFSPNGDWMLSSWGSTVLVADAHSFKRLAELDKSQVAGQSFGTADFSHDGLHIVASCDDKTVRIWSAVTFQEIAVLNHDFTDVSRFSVSPDGLLIVSMSRSGRIHVWNTRSYKEVASFQAHEFGSHCVAFSPDGEHFVSGGEDNTLRIWAPGMYDGDTVPLTGYVDRVLFSADCARVMSISVHDTLGQRSGINRTSILRVWNISKWEELGQIGRFSVMALSPDGTSAVTFDRTSGLLRFWNMSTFGSLATAECISNHITSVTYSPNGTRIICGTSGGTIQSWCPINFDKLTEFGAYVDSQHYSPAAFGFDSQYEPDVSQDFGPHIIYVMFSTNGTRFVSSTYRHARFWTADTLTLNSLGEISLQEPEISFECMAISHSGTHFVAGLGDKTVRVWSSITFQEHFRVEAHWLFMDQVAFSPDGESFLSLDRESETRAWTRGEMNSALWTESPLSVVELPTDGTAGALGIALSTSGWLRCWIHSRLRLIWLPHERRGKALTSSGERVAVATHNGAMTVLMFSAGKK